MITGRVHARIMMVAKKNSDIDKVLKITQTMKGYLHKTITSHHGNPVDECKTSIKFCIQPDGVK